MSGAPVLELRGITKQFAGTLALDQVSLSLDAGKVHALLGENGAGKSTLIKILASIYLPDAGELVYRHDAANQSSNRPPISFIHQDLGLVRQITVAENIAFIAGYPTRWGCINWRALRARAIDALQALESDIDPDRKVEELSSAEQAIVAIARSLACKADIIVLDEPTAALPEDDVIRLLSILEKLRARGKAILYVTHRLDEVFRIADTVTVLRDGKNVFSAPTGDISPAGLVTEIVGRPLESVFIHHAPREGPAVIETRGLCSEHVGPVDLAIREGEILALVGLRGAGHDVIGRALYGARPVDAGNIILAGEAYVPTSVNAATELGIGLVSSKRHEESLALHFNVRENLFFHKKIIADRLGSRISPAKEMSLGQEILSHYSVRPRDTEIEIAKLSGGNQQKVVLARWLASSLRLLILEEPTTGVDVGAKAEIYAMLREMLDRGLAILLVSSDFEEVAGIANRALVFDRGQVVRMLDRDELTVPVLTSLAGGQSTVASQQERHAPALPAISRSAGKAQLH